MDSIHYFHCYDLTFCTSLTVTTTIKRKGTVTKYIYRRKQIMDVFEKKEICPLSPPLILYYVHGCTGMLPINNTFQTLTFKMKLIWPDLFSYFWQSDWYMQIGCFLGLLKPETSTCNSVIQCVSQTEFISHQPLRMESISNRLETTCIYLDEVLMSVDNYNRK